MFLVPTHSHHLLCAVEGRWAPQVGDCHGFPSQMSRLRWSTPTVSSPSHPLGVSFVLLLVGSGFSWVQVSVKDREGTTPGPLPSTRSGPGRDVPGVDVCRESPVPLAPGFWSGSDWDGCRLDRKRKDRGLVSGVPGCTGAGRLERWEGGSGRRDRFARRKRVKTVRDREEAGKRERQGRLSWGEVRIKLRVLRIRLAGGVLCKVRNVKTKEVLNEDGVYVGV